MLCEIPSSFLDYESMSGQGDYNEKVDVYGDLFWGHVGLYEPHFDLDKTTTTTATTQSSTKLTNSRVTYLPDVRQDHEQTCRQGYKWSYEEEVFLVGAVMTRFFTYGSLTSARRNTDNTVWKSIKRTFDLTRSQYARSHGNSSPRRRSENALHRHWKLMKASKRPQFYEMWKKFEKEYKIHCDMGPIEANA